jgi:glucose/arabinose dehydrogenase
MRAWLLVAVLLPASAHAALDDAAFVESDFATIPGDPQVTSFAWAPDGSGRLFVTGKNGDIWIVKDGTVVAQPFYEFVTRAQSPSGELVTSSECGLLSLVFDPSFADNGYVYVFATVYGEGDQIEQQIIRFTAAGDAATARTLIIGGLPSRGANHDGGTLAFGPDGLLYWAVGDLGNLTGVGTDLDSPAAKIGRASPLPGAPPPPGPFNDGAGRNFDHIFARGFRNPYTMTFHPVTGELWVNVVGTSWEQIFVVPEGAHAGYPMENVEPGAGGYTTLSPVLAYPTGAPSPHDVGEAVRLDDVVTITTGSPHQLRSGNQVVISGIDDGSFNGSFSIASVPSTMTFTYAQSGGNAQSGNGTAAHGDHGSVILGGAFYDATQFPAAYRDNFFFGDYGTGDLVRLTVDGGQVASTVRFGTEHTDHIDTAVGPDGALYLVQHGGLIRRIAYDAGEQGLVVSPLHPRFSEGGRAAVSVSLAIAPAGPVSVTVARTGGDSDLGPATTTIEFDPTTWATPQAVILTSAQDGDTDEDVATFTASASGLPAETVTVRVTDLGAAPDAGGIGPNDDDDGCGCRVGGATAMPLLPLALLGFLLVRSLRRGR